jgi:hypothetical protein
MQHKYQQSLQHEPRGLGHALLVVLVEGGGGVDVPDRNILLLRRGRLLEGLQVRPGGGQRGGEEARELEDPDYCERAAVVYGGRGRGHRREEPGAVGGEGCGAARRLGEPLRRAGSRRVGRSRPHREAIRLAHCNRRTPSEGQWTDGVNATRRVREVVPRISRAGGDDAISFTREVLRDRRRDRALQSGGAGDAVVGTVPSGCVRRWQGFCIGE